ncbi:Tpr-related protein family member, putative [Theileria annulata]|uniref:Tpr-related protein family member, putative n=1 Tax=Theileria annulata TaxID=5874 RepID=Q4UI99_THEAN|nr:Tpr-related protein family member, putative [Theileria annulata]CAI73190.1 Tpr-related protein family member, putative [Theileria annulata]|eukprot:XP_953868.1 Tpr-related protein family member, putative [Theileria annulata]
MANQCPSGCGKAGIGNDKCGLLISSYVLAGLAMMLNIRLSYSSAPYALIRFMLPENLFSVFVRRIASALELWCLPSMLVGNIIDLLLKGIGADEAFRSKAGTGTGDTGKLRELALALHNEASSLNTEVNNVAGDDAAKVLKAKAGENDSIPGTLRYLAKELHEKAKALASAASGDSGAASALATAVGSTEGTSGDSLRKALKALAEDPGTALTTKATAVKNAYENSAGAGVKPRFTALQLKETTYNANPTTKPLYEAVVDAMTAFENVYKPEELLRDAVGNGAGESTGLQKALKDLYDGSILNIKDLNSKAKAVKNQYGSDWSGLKQKYKLVVKQETAYTAGETIKTQYETLVDAWNKFNNAYNTAISIAKFGVIIVPSIICQWLNFLTYVVLLIVYVAGGEQGYLTEFYGTIAVSGFVFGINMTLVYAADWNYTPVYIVGENCFPILTSFIHYITTLMFGNRRKWNSDYLIVCVDIVVAIIISFAAAVVWTAAYGYCDNGDTESVDYGHVFVEGFDTSTVHWQIISPTLMVIVGMGLVYAIYPGIAPGMIVPFYLIDKIEMVLLIATFFPPVIVALLNRGELGNPAKARSPKSCPDTGGGLGGWRTYTPQYCGDDVKTEVNNSFWHAFDILLVIKISLAVIFIYSLHYRDSSLSRSIINQPKMSTALSIIFYMCHEILLALGFAGVIANNGGTYVVLPAQYIGALFMIFLAFYSEGYIIEYKSHDPSSWPTEGMTKWNAFCYWCKKASKITNQNPTSWFRLISERFTWLPYTRLY